jgi:hypothetical protein
MTEPATPDGEERPMDDPLPERPIIDEPGRVVPVVDPRAPGAGQPIPVDEPRPDLDSGTR